MMDEELLKLEKELENVLDRDKEEEYEPEEPTFEEEKKEKRKKKAKPEPKKERLEEEPEVKPRFDTDDDLEDVITEEDLIEKAIEFVISELSEMGVKNSTLRRLSKILRMDASKQWIVSPTHFAWIVKQYLPRIPEIELGSLANALYMKFGQEFIRMKQQSMLTYHMYSQYGYNQFNPYTVPPITTSSVPHTPLPQPPLTPPPLTVPPATSPFSVQQPAEKKRVYTIVIDGQTITTDDYKEYLALKEWLEEREAKEEERQRRREEHELRMKKLEEELKQMFVKKPDEEAKSTENAVVHALQSQIANLATALADLRKQLDEERKKKEEEKLKELEEKAKKLDELIRNPFSVIHSWEETLRRMGYSRTGRSAYDLIDGLRQDIQTTINALLSRMPAPQHPYGGVYSREEREARIRKAEELIDESVKMASLEREILELSRDVYAPKERSD